MAFISMLGLLRRLFVLSMCWFFQPSSVFLWQPPFFLHIGSAMLDFNIFPPDYNHSMFFCFSFVFFAATAWDGIHTALGHVLFQMGLGSREIFLKAWTPLECHADVLCSANPLNLFRCNSYMWKIFYYCLQLFSVCFWKLMLCFQSSCYPQKHF